MQSDIGASLALSYSVHTVLVFKLMHYSLTISKLRICIVRIYVNIVEKIPEIYEAAVRKKPKNDGLLSHLFMPI